MLCGMSNFNDLNLSMKQNFAKRNNSINENIHLHPKRKLSHYQEIARINKLPFQIKKIFEKNFQIDFYAFPDILFQRGL